MGALRSLSKMEILSSRICVPETLKILMLLLSLYMNCDNLSTIRKLAN